MQYINNWQKDLNRKNSLTLIILFIFLFFFYEFILLSRLLQQRYLDNALKYSQKARYADKGLEVEKVRFYRKALKALEEARRLNIYQSRSYFEYAEILSEIGNDLNLSIPFEIESLGRQWQGEKGLYELAKLRYIEAILKEPTNPIYHQRLGSIYDKLSNAKNAEEEFNKAVLLDSKNIRIRLYLIQYFLIKDKNNDFLYHVNQVLKIYRGIRGTNPAGEVEAFFKSIGRQDLITK